MGVRVQRSTKCAKLRVRGMEDSVTFNDVAKALASVEELSGGENPGW